jgi:hypothetical protein
MHTSRSSRLRAGVAVSIIGLVWVFVGLPFAGAATAPAYTGCLAKGKLSKLAQGDAPLAPCKPGKETMIHLSGGDITSIAAGTGLTGGGTNGDITLTILESFRLPQGCSSGEIASFNGTGWSCAADAAGSGDITGVSADTGLGGGGTDGDVGLNLLLGYRLPQSCASGEVAKSDGSDTWSCASDIDTDTNSGGTVTDVTAGDGLTGGGDTSVTLSLATSFQLPQTCSAGDFVTWTGSDWGCAVAGDITDVTAGTGLTGGASSGNATLDLASSYRLPQSCTGAQIAEWNGSSWVCGTDHSGIGRDGFSRLAVDSDGDVGRFTSITVGSDGFPVVSYYDEGTSDLKIFHCGDVTCSTGVPTAVDTLGNVGTYASITVGQDGFPIVSYRDESSQRLKIYHCANVACTSGIATPAVDPGTNVGHHSSITVGRDGFPVVSYYDADNARLKVLHCTDVACTAGSTTFVDAGGNGRYTSITIGQDGFPIMSYESPGYGNLKIFHCTNVDCTAGLATLLTTSTDSARETSIAVGQDGFPVVSHFDYTNGDLKVFHCTNVECSTGSDTAVDTGGNVGGTTSIAIGQDDRPVISYYDLTNHDLKVFHCTNVDCTAGAATAVDTFGTVGLDTSITIGQDGLPVISYADLGNGDLRVAHCSNVRCIPFHRPR